MQDILTENRNIGDTNERILVRTGARMKILPPHHNMMHPRKKTLKKIRTNMTMANALQGEEEGTGGNLIAKIQSLQMAGVQGHTI